VLQTPVTRSKERIKYCNIGPRIIRAFRHLFDSSLPTSDVPRASHTMPDEFHYNAPGYSRNDSGSQSRPPPLPPPRFPEPNLPGPSRDEHPRSYYHDAPQVETSHSTYGDTHLQAPPWPEPRIRVAYDTSQTLQQAPIGQTPSSEYVPLYSVRSPNEPCHLPDFVRQHSQGPMTASWSPSQGPAGVQNTLGVPYWQVTGRTMTASPSGPFTRTSFSHILFCCILNLRFSRG
jgi:hypothetical protein